MSNKLHKRDLIRGCSNTLRENKMLHSSLLLLYWKSILPFATRESFINSLYVPPISNYHHQQQKSQSFQSSVTETPSHGKSWATTAGRQGKQGRNSYPGTPASQSVRLTPGAVLIWMPICNLLQRRYAAGVCDATEVENHCSKGHKRLSRHFVSLPLLIQLEENARNSQKKKQEIIGLELFYP